MSDRLFVDASALVALLAKEPGSEKFRGPIESARQCVTSPVALLETVMVLSSITKRTPREVEGAVRDFLSARDIRIIAIDQGSASQAIRAFERFGKGRHPARLNLGDCFSYACAKEHGLALLYKGSDFAQTDLA